MSFGRYTMLQWVTTVLIVCCFLIIAVWSQSTTLHSFPNRWGLPSPFEYTSTIVDTPSNEGPINRLYIDITVSNNSLDLKLAGFEKCYVEVGDPVYLLPIVPEDNTTARTVSGYIDLTGILTPFQHDLRWICDSMHLDRPASLYNVEAGLETKINVEVSIYDRDLTLITINSEDMITINDDPTITHTYSWVETYRSMFAMSLTFYRPATLLEDTFYITHPLLDINPITSMHISPDDNRLEDLRRNYRLIRSNQLSDVITCTVQNPPSGTNPSQLSAGITYVDKDGDGVLVPKLVVPSFVPDGREYACTITMALRTQPGAIATLLASVSLQNAVLIQYGDGGSGGDGKAHSMSIPLPRVVPDSIYNTADASAGIHEWISFHHSMDSTTEFEIGLAMTDRYLNTSTQQMTSYGSLQMTHLTFMIHSLTAAKIHQGTVQEFPLAEWSPTIACRDHTTLEYPEDVPLDDGLIHLIKERFSVFGKTCRIRLHQRPQGVPATGALGISVVDPAGNNFRNSYILPFDAMNNYLEPEYAIWYHDTSNIVATELPPPTAMPFSTIEEDGMYYAIGEINFQYLLSYQLPYNPDYIKISFFFADQVAVPPSFAESPSMRMTLASGNHIIHHDDVTLYAYDRGFDTTLFTADAISTIFQHGQPIRSPLFNIDFSMPVLDTTQPLRIMLKIPLAFNIDVSEMQIYPVSMPHTHSLTSTYSPMYGMFTVPRATPLTGYSYRCVTWDRMAASYVYGRTAPRVTDANSVPCPSYTLPLSGDVVAALDTNDTTIWRRVEYASPVEMAKSVTDFMCFYERAAVCVTPSTTVEGVYDVHPVADCPSFLGTTHVIPCNQVDHSGTAVQPPPLLPYSLALTKTAEITRDAVSRSISIFWNYIGDPHMTMTVAVTVTRDDISPAWVIISRDVPAYLSLNGETLFHPKYATLTLPFPNLRLSSGSNLHVRLTVNNVPRIESSEISTLPPDSDNKNGDLFVNCTEEYHKRIDPSTQLCSCRPDHKSNVPSGIDNPFIHPNDFICVARCGDGFVWNDDIKQCECEVDGDSCLHYGVCNPSTTQCTCFDGYFGEACQYDDEDDIDYVCEQLECVAEHLVVPGGDDDDDDEKQECKVHVDADDNTSTVVCNCADGFTGDQCQHQAVCGVRHCVNGRLVSPTGKPEECKCECNNDHITGSACNQCTLACRNGGVANTRCTACQCPAGYIGTTCTIPVWYHTFTLRNLPQHIVELILGTTASDKEQMAILQQTMVKYLLEDYSRVLSETFIVVDGNVNGGNDGNQGGDDNRIRVRVELSQFQTVIPPANPNAPYVHIQLMLYPADMTEEMLAYALQHGLVFDWSRVTDNLDFFKQFLREQGIIDDSNGDDALTPEIIDPGCTTRECRDKIIEEESSNHAPPLFTSTLATTLSMCLVAMLILFSV